jgi:hypothetical protein
MQLLIERDKYKNKNSAAALKRIKKKFKKKNILGVVFFYQFLLQKTIKR